MSNFQDGQHQLFGAPVEGTHPTSEATPPQGTSASQGIQQSTQDTIHPNAGDTTQGTLPGPVLDIDHDWVEVPNSAPSTSATGTQEDGRSTPRPPILSGAGHSLTADTLERFNQQNDENQLQYRLLYGTRSTKAKKDKASSAPQEEPMDKESWTPVANLVDSVLCGTGAWTDTPRPPFIDIEAEEIS